MPSTRSSFNDDGFVLASASPTDADLATLSTLLHDADAIVVGAGAGLSTAAGFAYSGPFFEEHFADFINAYGLTDMYSGGFYDFPSPEHKWAYWSRFIYFNRYEHAIGQPYHDLRMLLAGREYFVITTNVDHCFQRAGFDKRRLFYTQGDYGLWQCSVPCHAATYDNEEIVRRMVAEQSDLRVPSELVPLCPRCGELMTTNLRADNTFVEDDGWHAAAARYRSFLQRHSEGRVVYLELGVGGNTPGIIKYPFWRLTAANPHATYVCANLGQAFAPQAIIDRALLLNTDLAELLSSLRGAAE